MRKYFRGKRVPKKFVLSRAERARMRRLKKIAQKKVGK